MCGEISIMKHAFTILTLLAVGCGLCAADETPEVRQPMNILQAYDGELPVAATYDKVLIKATASSLKGAGTGLVTTHEDEGVLKGKVKWRERTKNGKSTAEEFTYNDEGERIVAKTTENGILVSRDINFPVGDDISQCEQVRTRIYEEYEHGKLVRTTEYACRRDDQGNLLRVVTGKSRDSTGTTKHYERKATPKEKITTLAPGESLRVEMDMRAFFYSMDKKHIREKFASGKSQEEVTQEIHFTHLFPAPPEVREAKTSLRKIPLGTVGDLVEKFPDVFGEKQYQ